MNTLRSDGSPRMGRCHTWAVFQLLPGTGVLLPHRAGTLRFGMSEHTARWALSTICDIRTQSVCGAAWAFSGEYLGLTIDVLGAPEGNHAQRLGYVELGRSPCDSSGEEPRGPALVPVLHEGVDLFGRPRHDVASHLPSDSRVNHGLGRTGGYIQSIGLRSPYWAIPYGSETV
ncbi:hypothetical protein [Streptomyces sp. NPDC059159]|uniref:hypothetical protein n=1 Tax=Streptomyces sp. NPDC059159 TaxID=3346747 RepID=UPI0036A043EC